MVQGGVGDDEGAAAEKGGFRRDGERGRERDRICDLRWERPCNYMVESEAIVS